MSKRRRRLPLKTYVEGIQSGDRVVLSQAITLVESTHPADRALAHQLMEACLPLSGNSMRVGISGVPGAGKSTFIDAWGARLADRGHQLAVLAVDPSSQRSKGSILGDKTRMNQLEHHPQAFVRPSATAGSLGGVARATREAMILCEAAGFDLILVETVGVGQSEIAVHGMVDFFLLLALPNAGDELQGIKKGIMEMAHGIFINKAEGDQLPLARMAKQKMGQALRLFPPNEGGWRPKILLGSALEGSGLTEVWELIQRYRAHLHEQDLWQSHRQQQTRAWLYDQIRQQLTDQFFSHPAIKDLLPTIEAAVEEFRQSPSQAAEQLIDLWPKGQQEKGE
ncbi:MAG: methylmalonyl Co-A mutase-associated GTPase MeaB [Bacteroidota bacterium]